MMFRNQCLCILCHTTAFGNPVFARTMLDYGITEYDAIPTG